MDDWITWEAASALTGLPVPTIDYAKRLGRIQHRPRHGGQPTLNRASVLAWAEWYAKEREAIEGRRRAPARGPKQKVRVYEPPDPGDWMSAQAAAEQLRVTVFTVRRLARLGDLDGRMAGQLWVSRASVDAYAVEEGRWVTYTEAAKVIGCGRHDVEALVKSGELAHRVAARCKPSIDRQAAVAFRPVWQRREAERKAAQRARAERRRPANAPPDDEDVWLGTAAAAIVLGISASAVRAKAEKGTLPHVRTPSRLWFRRRDVEIASAARAFAGR